MTRDGIRVLVPLEGTSFGAEVLDAVRSLLVREHTHVTVLHVGREPRTVRDALHRRHGAASATTVPMEPATEATRVFDSQTWDAARRALVDAVDPEVRMLRRAGWRVEVATAFGEPPDEIVAHARKHGIDLIAMATHARSGLARAVLGSVAEAVLRRAEIPVLMVRASEATSESEPDTAFVVPTIDPA